MFKLRVRSTAAALVAVVCFAGVVAANAAAFSPPEIGRCVRVAVGTGKFSSSSCIKEKAGGSFEWEPGAVKNKFSTKGGSGLLQTVLGIAVGCKTQESGGEFNSPKTVTGVVVKFTGCESAGIKCTTAGSATGELVTNPLEGRIGFENKAKKKVAFDLYPTPADEGLYITFDCGASLHITVGGSVLVNVKSDKMLTALTLKYKATRGVQKPEKFEGEPADVLITEINGKRPEQSGITISSVQTAEESLEVNALF
jgi:hypothetical protein